MPKTHKDVPCTLSHLPCTLYHVPVPCTMYPVPCTLYHVPCTLHHVPCTMYPVRCPIYPILCRYPVPCTMYNVPCRYHLLCTMYPVPCTSTYSSTFINPIFGRQLSKINIYNGKEAGISIELVTSTTVCATRTRGTSPTPPRGHVPFVPIWIRSLILHVGTSPCSPHGHVNSFPRAHVFIFLKCARGHLSHTGVCTSRALRAILNAISSEKDVGHVGKVPYTVL